MEGDLLRRAADLAERCERTATVTSTAFLTPAEQYALTNWARHRDCTLVLHGGSGINNQCILDGIANGIAKINVGTEIRQTYERTLGETNDVEKARAAVYTRMCETIRSFRIEGNQEKLFG